MILYGMVYFLYLISCIFWFSDRITQQIMFDNYDPFMFTFMISLNFRTKQPTKKRTNKKNIYKKRNEEKDYFQ